MYVEPQYHAQVPWSWSNAVPQEEPCSLPSQSEMDLPGHVSQLSRAFNKLNAFLVYQFRSRDARSMMGSNGTPNPHASERNKKLAGHPVHCSNKANQLVRFDIA
ncbi:hypothetical protein C0995_007580 [Termitomyces sp. Mi166|nr:hypothetical protein C0995_007580 [Termitomyces sp. Mi166\